MRFFFFLFLSLFVVSPVWADAPGSQPSPETQETPETVYKPENLGSLSFFLDKKNPTYKGESVHLGERDKAYFCLKLNPKDERLSRARRFLRRIEITLEGGDPPSRLTGLTKLRSVVIDPDSHGCYIGEVQIPPEIPPGKYKLIELDLIETSRNAIPYRDELENLSPVGLIEISSPSLDKFPPIIEKIVSYTPLIEPMHFEGHRAWAKVRFRVITTDLISGVKPDSLQIFFRANVDGNLVGILQPKCHPRVINLYYDCSLYFSRAQPDFRSRTLELILDSVSIADHFGNLEEWNTLPRLKNLFGGQLLHYIFYTKPTAPESLPQLSDEEKGNQLNKEMKGRTYPWSNKYLSP